MASKGFTYKSIHGQTALLTAYLTVVFQLFKVPSTV